jgi:hypothetical protein
MDRLPKKDSEHLTVKLFKSYGIHPHKFTDKQMCPKCGNLLWKRNPGPDYAIWFNYYYVEAKQSDSTGRWNGLGSFTPDQITKMDLYDKLAWVLLEMFDARLQLRETYLIPWFELNLILNQQPTKSLSITPGRVSLGTKDIFAGYELVLDKKTWEIPPEHMFWERVQDMLLHSLNHVERIRRGEETQTTSKSDGNPNLALPTSSGK